LTKVRKVCLTDTNDERTDMAKTVYLYINCWMCGDSMKIASRDYNHHASCGNCLKGKN